MPKSSSGQSISAFIKGLLAGPSGRGKANPVDHTKYGNLEETERAIRDRAVEYIAMFNGIDQSPVAAYRGNKHSVAFPASLDISGMTLTHNHPNKNWGGTLSYADVHNLLRGNVRSMRAVGRQGEGGYVFRQGNNPDAQGLYNRVAADRGSLDTRMRAASDAATAAGRSPREIRQAAVGVLHNYYTQTASQYGYVYRRRKQIGS